MTESTTAQALAKRFFPQLACLTGMKCVFPPSEVKTHVFAGHNARTFVLALEKYNIYIYYNDLIARTCFLPKTNRAFRSLNVYYTEPFVPHVLFGAVRATGVV